MDIWGVSWLLIAIVIFPFGYKPMILILSLASIFSAGKIITIGSVSLPIYYVMEIFTILRLALPYKNNKAVGFSDSKSFFTFFIIFIIWLYTFLVSNFFEGLKVYSSNMSMEDNFSVGGIFLKWGGANINQLMLISVHLILALIIYKRRYVLDKKFYYKSIIFSAIIFTSISLIWKFYPSLYYIIGNTIFNNTNYSVNAFFEERLSGTFLEPSLAGLFLGSLTIFFLMDRSTYIKFLGVIFCFLGFLNMSSTFIFTLFFSFLVCFSSFRLRLDYKILWLMCFFIIIILFLIIFNNSIFDYIENKNYSQSGVVRAGVNENSINNIIQTYFLGVGLGSERTSSLLITVFNNLGVVLGPLLIFFVYRLLSPIKTRLDLNLRMILYVCIVGSFVSIPELTGAIMWNLIFSNILVSKENDL